MMTLIIVIHVTICAGLIGLVLIQRGRGSGLVESLSGVESVFGTKTNTFLTRATTILSILFFITCLSLAVLSVRQSKSLMRNTNLKSPAAEAPKQKGAKEEVPQAEVPQPAGSGSQASEGQK
jgi:preprotein translocase subunit SecG